MFGIVFAAGSIEVVGDSDVDVEESREFGSYTARAGSSREQVRTLVIFDLLRELFVYENVMA